MRIALLAATATLALLAACREQEPGEAANAGANAAAPTNQASSNLANPLGAPVSGDEAKEIMDERHEGMEEIGDSMKALGGALKAPSPDLDKIRKETATMARLAPEVSSWFPPGSGPEAGKTHAKAEIWQKPHDFADKTRAFQQAAAKLNAAAQGGDLAAIKAAQGELGKSCKGCHDLYRREKKKGE